MKTKLILQNRQAIGDILVMTTAIRDLHKAYPDMFETYVSTTCEDVWINNPYITRGSPQVSDVKSFMLGYSKAIKSSNQRRNHFSAGFIRELSEKLGLAIPLTDIRPYVHLSDEEKSSKNRPTTDPYWVIIAGGKPDMTAKIWDHQAYQEVVNKLKNRLTFVQLGSTRHIHKPLQNVINLLGKTSIRQMLITIYHSEGVICPITSAMHAAAAFNKPCVVIGGGREPWWWEAYTTETWKATIPNVPVPTDFVNHIYLHTIGKLPCCIAGGCWKSKINMFNTGQVHGNSLCSILVNGLSQKQPKCMTLITPDMVVEAVNIYLNKQPIKLDLIPEKLDPTILNDPIPQDNTVSARTHVPARVHVPARIHVPVFKPIPLDTQKKFNNILTRVKQVKIEQKQNIILQPHIINVTGTYVDSSLPKNSFNKNYSGPEHIPTSPPLVLSNVYKATMHHISNLKPPVTIMLVAYGEYDYLLKRLLDSLYGSLEPDVFHLRAGLNEVCKSSFDYICSFAIKYKNITIYNSEKNICKYPLLRQMIHNDPIKTEWSIYFDDDSYVAKWDWLIQLAAFLSKNPNIAMAGRVYWHGLPEAYIQWARAAKWYKGKPIKSKVRFITGGWWIIKNHVLYDLNWPDERLSHNGGDVMLGVALDQYNYNLANYCYGVEVNKYRRRGVSQRPLDN